MKVCLENQKLIKEIETDLDRVREKSKRKYTNKILKPQVRKRDNNICHFCLLDVRDVSLKNTVHHILPLNLGGNNTPTNTITICLNCHQKLENLLRVPWGTLKRLGQLEGLQWGSSNERKDELDFCHRLLNELTDDLGVDIGKGENGYKTYEESWRAIKQHTLKVIFAKVTELTK